MKKDEISYYGLQIQIIGVSCHIMHGIFLLKVDDKDIACEGKDHKGSM